MYFYIIKPIFGYYYWASQLFLLFSFSIYVWFLSRLLRIDYSQRIIKPKPKEVFLIIIMAIFAIHTFLPFAYPKEFYNFTILGFKKLQLPGNEFTIGQNLQYLVISCILSPIVQEILFREIILRRLLIRYPHSPIVVIVITSILFGLFHFIISFVAIIILSIIISYIYFITDSLVLAIIFHISWNTYNLLFSFIRAEFIAIHYPYLYFLFFPVGVVVILLLLNELKKHMILSQMVDE